MNSFVSDVFNDRWARNPRNIGHPAYCALLNSEYSDIESRLSRLSHYHLFGSRNLKNHLRNPKQYEDTLAEIDVILYLAENGFEPEWGRDPPDITIPKFGVDIEVMRLHDARKLTKKPARVVIELDDIGRIAAKIEDHEGQFARALIVLICDVAASVGWDEYVDLFVGEYSADKRTHTFIPLMNGPLMDKKFAHVAAIVRMRHGQFKGILNPNSTVSLPQPIMRLFDVREFLKVPRH